MRKIVVKYLLRLLGLVIITLILLFILNIIFAFNGNPIQAGQAERNIKKYINKNFDISQYDLGNIEYLFKPNKYYMHLSNKGIKDDNFNIYYDPSTKKIDANEYQNKVLNKKNTIERLEKEYESMIQDAINKNFIDSVGKKYTNISITFGENNNLRLKDINLDATLEEIKPYPIHLNINMDGNLNNTFDTAVMLRMLKKIFIDNSIIVDTYTFKFESTFSTVKYLNITSEEIAINNLDEILHNYITTTDSERKDYSNA